ncbi:hypothetical protein SFUMM280S_07065 [Streptomyces fumanus]
MNLASVAGWARELAADVERHAAPVDAAARAPRLRG